ncbi:YbaB/EbfC family nucleoid-associated protein [Nonomuraea zeae]|uniref:YbaB/EbfC family nucleoid-associated protein n=1 Tax=Nonomuraea zeae TaxID=1642303 RepID=A0A5S4G613_9ACTN|nr:YbaB/EbfC family nucleoid-associated protein [Nonomuraea zeae]TMR28282.1 YbaB/EbfC family nucleoid-associated protein [Nonomuraea zeae]
MTAPADPFDGGDHEIGRLLSGFQQDMAALERLSDQIAAVRGRGEAAEGRVVVEVTQSGGLAGLTIDPRAMRLGSTELAAAILDAAAKAARDAEHGTSSLVAPFISGTVLDGDDARGSRR